MAIPGDPPHPYEFNAASTATMTFSLPRSGRLRYWMQRDAHKKANDRKVYAAIGRDRGTTETQIARKLGMSIWTVFESTRRLHEQGAIGVAR